MQLLVCVDFSPLTERVLREAIAIAKPASAPVVLLHVAPTERALTTGGSAPPQAHRSPPEDLPKRRADLDAMAARLIGEGLAVKTELALSDDQIVETIVDRADAAGATHVLLGSHGHGRLFELLAGSVTQGVLRRARVPVIVVPTERAE